MAPEELIGGTRVPARAPVDATATRVLTKGEPISGPSGRADDFSWPRGGPVNAEPVAADPAATPAPAPAAAPPAAAKKPATAAAPQTGQGGQQGGQAAGRANPAAPQAQPGEPVQRRARTNTEGPRPPLSIQGLFR